MEGTGESSRGDFSQEGGGEEEEERKEEDFYDDGGSVCPMFCMPHHENSQELLPAGIGGLGSHIYIGTSILCGIGW